jgi:hypothetical protein
MEIGDDRERGLTSRLFSDIDFGEPNDFFLHRTLKKRDNI